MFHVICEYNRRTERPLNATLRYNRRVTFVTYNFMFLAFRNVYKFHEKWTVRHYRFILLTTFAQNYV